jgi:hypothetical protein
MLTVFPRLPFFSTRSLATSRAGIGSSAVFLLHRQSLAGQPQLGQILP